MVWLASILLFVVLGAGAIGFVLYRRSFDADDSPAQELPPDMLIALGRANDAALGRRARENEEPASQGIWRDDGGQTPQ